MKAICPNNSEHNNFYTTVHVVQKWIVDEHGNHIKTSNECLQVTHRPDMDSFLQCSICGAKAVMK